MLYLSFSDIAPIFGLPLLALGIISCIFSFLLAKSKYLKTVIILTSIGITLLIIGTHFMVLFMSSDYTIPLQQHFENIQLAYFLSILLALTFFILAFIQWKKLSFIRSYLFLSYAVVIVIILGGYIIFSRAARDALTIESIAHRFTVDEERPKNELMISRERWTYKDSPWSYPRNRNRQRKKTIKALKKAIAKYPTCKKYVNLANLLATMGKPEEAKSTLKESTQNAEWKHAHKCYNALAAFYVKQGRLEKAESTLEKSIKYKASPEAYFELSAFYARNHEITKAISTFETMRREAVDGQYTCDLAKNMAAFYLQHEMITESKISISFCNYTPSKTEFYERYNMLDLAEKTLREDFEENKLGNLSGRATMRLVGFLKRHHKFNEAEKVLNEVILLRPEDERSYFRKELQKLKGIVKE